MSIIANKLFFNKNHLFQRSSWHLFLDQRTTLAGESIQSLSDHYLLIKKVIFMNIIITKMILRYLIFMEPIHINRKARQGESHTSQVDETPLFFWNSLNIRNIFNILRNICLCLAWKKEKCPFLVKRPFGIFVWKKNCCKPGWWRDLDLQQLTLEALKNVCWWHKLIEMSLENVV